MRNDAQVQHACPPPPVWLKQQMGDLGAEGAVLLALHSSGRRLEIVGWAGYTDAQVAPWHRISMDLPTPLTDAVRSGSAIVVPGPEDFDERYPGLSRERHAQQRALVALPVRSPAGECVGVLGLSFAGSGPGIASRSSALAALGRYAYPVLQDAGTVSEVGPAGERSPQTSSRVQALTAELSASLTPEAILDVMTAHGRAVLGADMVQISLLSSDQQTFTLLRARGTPAAVYERYRTYPADAALPAGDVLRSGLAVSFHADERAGRYPSFADVEVPQQSFATLPLRGQDRMLGVVAFGWLVRQEFRPAQMALAHEVADLCSAALDRAHRYRREEQGRTAAEAVNRRLRALQNMTVHLAGAVEPADVADVLIHEVVDALGAQAAVMAEFDGMDLLAILASRGPGGTAVQNWHCGDIRHNRLALDVVVGQQSVLLRSQADLAERYPGLSSDDVGPATWFSMPLVVGGRVVGMATFGWDVEHDLSEDELEFLGAVGAHAAVALDRVALLRGARVTAETLQRALLPQVLPTADGWEVATYYAPAVEGTQVGGDWYDTFPLPDGTVGLVLGDVMGKGLRAASSMGAVRSALRAFATVDPDPARVLSALDTYLATFAPDDIVTCFLAVLDPRSGRVRYSSAGHLPALVIRRAVPPRWLDAATTTPLGVPPPGGRVTATDVLATGDVVHLYSDGLVEDRSRPLSEGLDQLTAAAGDVAAESDLGAAVQTLVGRLLAGRRNTDDLAVLAMRQPRRT